MAKEGRLGVTFPPPFVLEADTGENPKGPSEPSQFHHKYPDRASGADLIVQGPAAALPETMLPAVGGCRPRQEMPPDVPQGPWPRHRSAASDQARRHFEAGLDSDSVWPGICELVHHLPAQAWEMTGKEDGTGLDWNQSGVLPLEPYHGQAPHGVPNPAI